MSVLSEKRKQLDAELKAFKKSLREKEQIEIEETLKEIEFTRVHGDFAKIAHRTGKSKSLVNKYKSKGKLKSLKWLLSEIKALRKEEKNK